MTADTFGATAVRERVLAAWAASPVRFREDANAEEDYALGSYRDRLVVELAQNAADAAGRASVPGRLLLALRRLSADDGGAVLVAANTGAPLDAEGVQSLATLRASAKAGESVGRFGVGFAAVLAVTDEPMVLSRTGGVRFSAADTRALVEKAAAAAPELAVELSRREGHVPVLRLPFEAEGTPPVGYDTAVVLPLRGEAAVDLVARRLAEVDDALLLALPALDEIVIETPGEPPRTLSDVGDRWQSLRREGRFDTALLAGRPTEERARPAWSLTWAVPREGGHPARGHTGGTAPAGLPPVLHAPTPTDEPLPWPALLLATFPLEPGRRHVAPGPATDALVEQAAAAYTDLLADLAARGRDVLGLIPVGLPAGAVDAALREAVLRRLHAAPILRSAEDASLCLRPRDAVVLDGPAGRDASLVAALAPTVAGLVVGRAGQDAVLRLLDVPRMALADVVDALPATADTAHGGPRRWHDLYAALAPAAGDAEVREALGALPVPLAGGRVVRGARGLLLVRGADAPAVGGADVLGAALAALGLRAVHPVADHPLLERLGAQPVAAAAVLADPAVRAAVRAAAGSDDEPAAGYPDRLDRHDEFGGSGQVAPAVLALVALAVADGRLRPGDLPWLGDLLLRDDTGRPASAATLVLPGSFAERVLDLEDVGVVDPALVELWGPQVLAAAGVLDDLAVLRAGDVAVNVGSGASADGEYGHGGEPESDAGDGSGGVEVLDGWDDYAAEVLEALDAPDAVLADVIAVRDLDAVRPECWPEVLAWLCRDPAARRAVVEPARVLTGAAGAQYLPYTAWWLRSELCGDALVADPEASTAVRALLRAAPDVLAGLDGAMRRALGVVADPADLDAAAVPGVLERLSDPDTELAAETLVVLWRRLAELARDGATAEAPDAVRVVDGPGSRVVGADDAVVVDAPYLLQHPRVAAVAVTAPPGLAEDLADLLDVAVAADVVAGVLAETGEEAGQPAPVPDAVRRLLPAGPARWCEHDRLVVDGAEVDWWVDDDGVHASTLDGLARALAWQGGVWPMRFALTAVLTDPEAVDEIVLEQAFG